MTSETIATTTPPRRLTRQEADRFRREVKRVHDESWEARFGTKAYPLDEMDFVSLERSLSTMGAHFMALSFEAKMDKVRTAIRNRFASDGVLATRAYLWFPDISRYFGSPLNARGESKSDIAAMDSEIARKNAAIIAEASQRSEVDKAAADEDQHARAVAKVVWDLGLKGYEAFRPVRPVTGCDLVAIPKSSNTPTAIALRIVVRSGPGTSIRRDVYVATVKPEPDAVPHFQPPLER